MEKKQRRGRHAVGILLILACLAFIAWWKFPVWKEYLPEIPAPAGTDAPAPAATPAPSPTPVPRDEDADKIRISELMVKNRASLPDEEGDFPDWIELENISEDPVDLSGWRMSDSGAKPGWVFPQTLLQPGERLVIFASGKDLPGHADFSLSGGETLRLFTDLGAPVQELRCPEGEADCAWIPLEEGGWRESRYPTPGYPNTAEGYEELMSLRGAPGPLVINEAVTDNRTGKVNSAVGLCDWVELKNISDEPVLLANYYLSDDADQRLLFRLPAATLQPGELFLLRCDKDGASTGSAPLCDAFSLDSSCEQLYLSFVDGTLVDYASLRGIPYKGSYGRMSGSEGWFYFEKPSPGTENDDGCRRVSAQPTSLEPDGVFNGVDSVTVTLQGEGKIYYTTDGKYPTWDNAQRYREPFTLEKTGLVRAFCVEEGALPSRAVTLSYIINENHCLPIVSLAADDSGLAKIYRGGVKDTEVPASLALYEPDGGGFKIPCGVKMHGETSLILPKKNMSVRFRGCYGQAELDYDVFGDGGVCQFNNLLLRSGQDYYHSIVRNELCNELALAATDRVLISRNRYCILYIDGVYAGIYALGEKMNEAMYAHYAGVSRESVTVETAPLRERGQMYPEVHGFAEYNDLREPENYEEICKHLDVDSLIDWLILEGVFANDDLSFGNVRYCRSTENDGKWRLMFYDLDSTFYNVENCFTNLISPWAIENRQVARLLGRLLRNPDFRDRLLTRAGELIPTALSNERILEEFDLLCAEIAPEVARDYKRFGMYYSSWENNQKWLRRTILDYDWNESCIDYLCSYLKVTPEERAHYFPQPAEEEEAP